MIEFDPHKTEDSNKFSATGVSVGGELSRVFLIPEAPFYTEGCVVKNNGTPITEGKKTIWSASKEKAGKQIFSLIRRKKSVGYVSKRWGAIALLIKLLPRWVRNRI